MTKNYVVNSFFWGVIAKLADACMKFVSVPFLLAYFGKDNFGLIALASSVNAYLQLLDLGINTGAVKFFSEWISKKDYKTLDAASRTSITFYGIVGLLNTILLVLIAFWGLNVFSLAPDQAPVLRRMFLILALFSVINWSTSVFNQLLTANENIAFVQKMGLVQTILNLLVIFATVYYGLSITTYFAGSTLVTSSIVIPLYSQAKKQGLITSFMPAFNWTVFEKVFRYSLAILVMIIFQMSATKLRPVLLSIFAHDAMKVVADFRIMETITVFIISIGGMFTTIFMPKTSKLLLENSKEKIADFAYEATLYTSIICILLCVPMMMCANEVLTLYVGDAYSHLVLWLNVWIVTILLYLHNSPVASLVLATGKTRMLVYSSAIACLSSLTINVLLAKNLGVGSAVVGYLLYIIIQMLFYYLYFTRKILGLNSFSVFKSFIKPTSMGLATAYIVILFDIHLQHLLIQVIVKVGVWLVMFALTLQLSGTISFQKFLSLYRSRKVNVTS